MSQCSAYSPTVQFIETSFGFNKFQYKLAEWVSNSLQYSPTDESNKKLHEAVFESKNTKEYFDSYQLWPIIFSAFGFVIIAATILFFFFTACWQCFSSCRPENSKQSKKSRIFLIISLTFAIISIFSGIYVFNASQDRLTESFENAIQFKDSIKEDFNVVTVKGFEEIQCEISTTGKTISKHVSEKINKVMKNLQEKIGFSELVEFDKSSKNERHKYRKLPTLTNPTCGQAYKELRNSIIEAEKTLEKISSQLDSSNDGISKNQDAMNDNIKKKIDQIFASITNEEQMKKVTNNIEQLTEKYDETIENHHKSISKDPIYGAIQTLSQLLFNIPSVLAITLACITILTLALYSKSAKSNIPSFWIMLGFYIVLPLTIIFTILFMITFFGGWAASTICVAEFENPQQTLLKTVEFEFELFDNKIQFNVGNFVNTCQDPNKTLFSVINGRNLLSNILQKMDFNKMGAEIPKLETFEIEKDDKEKLNQQINLFKAQKSMIAQCSELKLYKEKAEMLIAQAEKYISYLDKIKLSMQKIDMQAVMKNEMQTIMDDTVNTLVDKFETKVFKCHPYFEIHQKAGNVVCDHFGKPIHGLWSSSLLTAISIFFLALKFLFAYRWIHSEEKGHITLNEVA